MEFFNFQNNIILENLYYKYPNTSRLALKNINLNIPINTTVGFIGPSGSGKTTTADIILGLIKPQKGFLKVDKKIQSLIYNGLVNPAYPSISGENTNLLGHLLEKYQFVEPNYNLVSEALWLLADPNGYKAQLMKKGETKAVEKTVRKLKTTQSDKSASNTGNNTSSSSRKPATKRKISRGNIFKRF